MTKNQSKKRNIKVPDAFVLVFIMIILAVVATYLIPAGEFERIESDGRTVVVPGSYEEIPQNPRGIGDIFLSIQLGMVETAGIIFLVLFTGGAFAVIEATGAVNAGITSMVNRLKNRRTVLMITIFVLFALGGATGTITNAVIAFVPLGVMVAKALKLDAIVAVSIVMLGSFTGISAGFLNPHTLGVAHTIAELDLFSGMGYRLLIFTSFVVLALVYVIRYAKRIYNDPSSSIIADNPFPTISQDEMGGDSKLTRTHILIILVFVGSLGIYVYGAISLGWGINEMSAMFLIITVITGFIGRLGGNETVRHFMEGCQKLVYGALIIGVARAIYIIMNDGQILDTIVLALSSMLEPLSPMVATVGMFLSNTIFNFFVNSGSAQATIIMPLMTPLADTLGISRQIAVQAYQFGDGITNSFFPTSGALMASLAAAGVPYTKWIRFVWPLILIFTVAAAILLIIAMLFNWQ